MKKGFVTLATGDEQYYKIALNLLRSYKCFSSDPLPFAIVCDRENSYTEYFDDVVLLDNVTSSYMDKLSLLKVVPYEENIFIDADCLAYDDLNMFFDQFKDADDISCFGEVFPRDSADGYFKISDIGEYADKVSYCIDMHGGIMFFRKSNILLDVYQECLKIAENYHNYKFKYFKKPADEPIYALSMAVYGLHPIKGMNTNFSFYPLDRNIIALDILNKKAIVKREKLKHSVSLVHFGSTVTREKLYLIEEYNLGLLCNGKSFKTALRGFFRPYVFSYYCYCKRKKMDVHIYNLKCKLKPVLMKFLRRG